MAGPQHMNTLDDGELLALFRKEESRHYAFNQIVRLHQRRLYAFIRRMVTDPAETEDILQDVFLKAWTGLENFRGEARLDTWLFRVAHNESISHLRRLKRRSLFNERRLARQLTVTLASEEHFSGDAVQQKLQRAVMNLPPKQRAVFTMKYFDGMKYSEMSRVTGTSEGALKASFHIAVKKIEQELTASDQTIARPKHQTSA
ncbi:MAG: sigma-70 family RNA polymerase sigma factor [Flavobacteriales bacterium]|nr:sigma-70 family RNA polymerase sigma factor [Flavobacteriales bacterium]